MQKAMNTLFNKEYYFCCILVLCLPLLTFDSKAETFKLSVVTEDAYSFQYRSKSTGNMEGPAAELVEKVINTAGIEFKTKVLPWARAYKEAEETVNTLIYSIVRTPERDSKFHWLGVLSKPQYCLYAMKTANVSPAVDISLFKNQRVATILNSASFFTLKKEGFHFLVPLTSAEQAFGMLTKNRVDFITANKKTFQSICANYSDECENIVEIAPIEMPESSFLYFAINKESDPRIVSLLQETYQKLLSAGEISIF